jgi:hypothetical protein
MKATTTKKTAKQTRASQPMAKVKRKSAGRGQRSLSTHSRVPARTDTSDTRKPDAISAAPARRQQSKRWFGARKVPPSPSDDGDRLARPYALAAAARERSIAQDRAEFARRAANVLKGELHDEGRVLAAKSRIASLWAVRLLTETAEEVVEEYLAAKEEAEALALRLQGLARCRFPNGGQIESAVLTAALNAGPPTLSDAVIADAMEPWLSLHQHLTEFGA